MKLAQDFGLRMALQVFVQNASKFHRLVRPMEQ